MNRIAPSNASSSQAKVSRRFFFIGCFGLPWVWFISCIYFWPKLIKGEPVPDDAKRWLWRSTFGVVFSMVLLITWIAIVQFQWKTWNMTGIMLYVPEGDDENW